jgi:hypothetical protein
VGLNYSVLFLRKCVQYVVIGDDYTWNVRYLGRMPNVHIEPTNRQRADAVDMCLLTRTHARLGGRLTHKFFFTFLLFTLLLSRHDRTHNHDHRWIWMVVPCACSRRTAVLWHCTCVRARMPAARTPSVDGLSDRRPGDMCRAHSWCIRMCELTVCSVDVCLVNKCPSTNVHSDQAHFARNGSNVHRTNNAHDYYPTDWIAL